LPIITRGAADAERDIRGTALKFYTEEVPPRRERKWEGAGIHQNSHDFESAFPPAGSLQTLGPKVV
jgi:hypothetical protein